MKGKNWREYEPPKRRRRRRRKGGLLRKLCFALVLFLVGYVGFLVYYNFGKPYTVALDAGHGGADVGAEGVIQEVALTEQTVAELQTLLEEDGRFRVVLSRKAGEGATVTERNHKFRRRHPDLMLSMATQATAAVPMVLSAILRLPAMKIMKKALPLQRFWRRKCKI